MSFSELFKNSFETTNKASDHRLLSHTYSNDYRTVQNTISSAFNNVGIKLINVDNKYHEMYFEHKKYDLIMTLTELSMYEVKVNIKLNTHYLLPFKRPLSIIEQLYKILDAKLNLKYKGGSDDN